jgi:hypothetical protein
LQGTEHLAQPTDWALFLERHRYFVAKSGLLDALLDSTAGGRPKFLTTQWELLVAASSVGGAEARAAMEEVYRFYCYPVYAFIRRRGHARYRALLREEVARTVATPAEVDEELRYLRAALSG